MKTTKVTAVICPKCGDKIFSRTRHDFHYCSCGEIAIDGGRDYTKVCYKSTSPERIEIKVPATEIELHKDWNTGADKFGIIKGSKKAK
jgi:hypothetical protein